MMKQVLTRIKQAVSRGFNAFCEYEDRVARERGRQIYESLTERRTSLSGGFHLSTVNRGDLFNTLDEMVRRYYRT